MKKSDKFIQVSLEDCKKFLKNYPNTLDYDCCMIYEPPLHTYNDFSTGLKGIDSIVAYHRDNKYYLRKTKCKSQMK